jgi:hypothetical protein
MSTDIPSSKGYPWVAAFNGKFALSIAELSLLLKTPEAQLLYMARPSALNAPPPKLRFCIRKPTNADVYRVPHALLSELNRPLSRIDEEKVKAIISLDEPTLLTYGDYLWLSPRDCNELYHHGEVNVSTFENGFRFDDHDIPRFILLNNGKSTNTKLIALGRYTREKETNKPLFTSSSIKVTQNDIISLVLDLSAIIDFAGLDKNSSVVLEATSTQPTQPELTWEAQPEYIRALKPPLEAPNSTNETIPQPSTNNKDGSEAIETKSIPPKLKDIIWEAQPEYRKSLQVTPEATNNANELILQPSERETDSPDNADAPPSENATPPSDTQEPIIEPPSQHDKTELNIDTERLQVDESQTGAVFCKDELPENADEIIMKTHYVKANRDLQLLMAAARELWGDDCSKEILTSRTYPSNSQISTEIRKHFKDILNIELSGTDCKHLASLIRPGKLRGIVNSESEKQRNGRFINGFLLGLFETSTLINESSTELKITLQELLIDKFKMSEHLAKIGAKALRGELSAGK